MNVRRIITMAVIVIALGTLFGGWTNRARTAWEYKAIYLQQQNQGLTVEGQMNRLGEEGWQLVTVELATRTGGDQNGMYFFQRAK